ncbi:MAG: RluA family pseudouridine synthase [Candidatus Paceibacterota bacterium]|jgi:23S rRNA pseudouridine1911/1915/1917 synthase
MRIKILFEDSNILAIDKPSGVSVHPDGRSKEETITDWVVKKYPKIKNVGEPIFFEGKEIKKPGIVHRLDKETSGVLLLVKNQKAYEFFKNQFKGREIKKTYHSIVSGFVKNDHGTINKPIGRSPKDFRRHLAGRGVRGELREAITEYRVLKRFFTAPVVPFLGVSQADEPRGSAPRARGDSDPKKKMPERFSYLEIHPKTGRTHQIRVHMKYINHPVACDSLYNPNGSCPKGLKRLALHAKSIEFKNLKDKTIKVESPLPLEFKKIINLK